MWVHCFIKCLFFCVSFQKRVFCLSLEGTIEANDRFAHCIADWWEFIGERCLDDFYGWSMRDHPGRWSMRDDFVEIIYHRWSILDDLRWIIHSLLCWQADFVAPPCKCQNLIIFEFYSQKIKALNITKRWVQIKRTFKMKNGLNIVFHVQCLTPFRKTFFKILQDAILLATTLQHLQAHKCTTIHTTTTANDNLTQNNFVEKWIHWLWVSLDFQTDDMLH